jgi:predicted SPOUT superfamily RNA methylase MTH1
MTIKPPKRHPSLHVAIPASLVTDIPHLREKTAKIGFVGRALAIFRVEEVIIYPDRPSEDQKRDTDLIATVLSYMETPQYLRKHLFKIRPELRYAGTLPPLRTPHHPLGNRLTDLKPGEYREGVVESAHRIGAYADIGVEKPILVSRLAAPKNTRLTVKIIRTGKGPTAVPAERNEIETYWGYRVTISKQPFVRMVETESFDLVIATSRLGTEFTRISDGLKEKMKRFGRVLVAFGAPNQGLHEIAEREGVKLDSIADYVINTIPNQATETVRTEEAIYATLSLLNVLAAKHAS